MKEWQKYRNAMERFRSVCVSLCVITNQPNSFFGRICNSQCSWDVVHLSRQLLVVSPCHRLDLLPFFRAWSAGALCESRCCSSRAGCFGGLGDSISTCCVKVVQQAGGFSLLLVFPVEIDISYKKSLQEIDVSYKKSFVCSCLACHRRMSRQDRQLCALSRFELGISKTLERSKAALHP